MANLPGTATASTAATIRAATHADLPAVASFLSRVLGGGGPDHYRRYLDYAWRRDKPDIGVAVEADGCIRGFLGAIYADRPWRGGTLRCCNLTSIAVEEDYRRHTLRMFAAVFAAKDVTFTCFSASPEVAKILDFFKFRHRPAERVVVTPVTGLVTAWRSARTRVISDPATLEHELDADQRIIARDHSTLRCGQLLLVEGDRRCFAVTARRGRGAAAFADVLHASDPSLLLTHLPAVQLALFRVHRTVLTGIDRVWVARPPRLSFVYRKLRPLYLRSSTIGLDEIDMLYSELALGAA